MRLSLFSLGSLRFAALSTMVAASGLMLAPAALAATPAPVAAPLVAQYGPPTVTYAELSATTVIQGNSVTITVRNPPGVNVVSVTLFSTPQPLPVVPANANGVAVYTINTAGLESGAHRVVFTFSNGTTQTLGLTVTTAQGSGVPGADTSGGGLAFTGVNAVLPLAATGTVLVLGGAAAVISGRRRKSDVAA